MNRNPYGVDRAKVGDCQGTLFPRGPREICDTIGLNWWAAVKLHTDGWLSFNPEASPALDERQEVELRFVGALIAAGCDNAILTRLLAGLEKPYCYRPERVYYDWLAKSWRLLPDPPEEPDAEQVFSDWLSSIERECDISALQDILDQVNETFDRLGKSGTNRSQATP